jgi:hypothetical protein
MRVNAVFAEVNVRSAAVSREARSIEDQAVSTYRAAFRREELSAGKPQANSNAQGGQRFHHTPAYGQLTARAC